MLIRGRSCIAAFTACAILLFVSTSAHPSYDTEAGRKYAVASQRLLDQGVEAERRNVTFVEDDRMAQRNRSAVVGLFGEQIEDFARARAIPPIPCRGGRAVESHPCILIRNGLK